MRKIFILILIMLIGLGSGCGTKTAAQKMATNSLAAGAPPDGASREIAFSAADSAGKLTGTKMSIAGTGEQNKDGPAKDGYPRKVIQNLSLAVQVANIKEGIEKVRQKTQASGGYVAELNLYDSENQSANLVLRVPAQGLEEFGKWFGTLGKVLTETLHSEDITGAFYDTEARLNNAKLREKRLLELLAQAKNMDEILKIEGEVSRVREQVEQMQGQINRWNHQVDLATVHLTLQTKPQVVAKQNWEPMGLRAALQATKEGFILTLKVIYHGIGWLLVMLGYLAPLLLAGLPLGYFWWKKRKNRQA